MIERNGRKTLTTVQGLSKDFSPKALLKAFKKEYACNGTIIQDEELGEVIQLQGDHRTKVFEFLTSKEKDKMGKYALPKDNIKACHHCINAYAPADNVQIHGF